MEQNTMILAEDQYYSLDSFKTRLNNNVLVVGTSGAGKTRSIVTPNLLQASGSYIISDPKGTLHREYREYLKKQGYRVRVLDFSDMRHSCHYNFFNYIRSSQDIVKVAHMLVNLREYSGRQDPFWDDATQLLFQSVIAYLMEAEEPKNRNLDHMLKLICLCQPEDGLSRRPQSRMDSLMDAHREIAPESFACSCYEKFKAAAEKTLMSILITAHAKLGLYDVPEIRAMTSDDNIDIASIGKRKTALFVVVSDTDRSMDSLVNLFFSQCMNELCRVADKECADYRLPVPVRFILDDFATNCRIDEFPRIISSIRSRNISAMLMIQAESQLINGYGDDGRTIIGNCDTYVYLGGNDPDTAKQVALRCDLPMKKILYMPVGTEWIFRRGQAPVNARLFDIEPFRREKLGKGERREKAQNDAAEDRSPGETVPGI